VSYNFTKFLLAGV